MDYTSWCDRILEELARWLKRQPYGLYGNLDSFTTEFLDSHNLPFSLHESVIASILDVFRTFGLPDNDKNVQFKHQDLNVLTDAYGRWQAAFNINFNPDHAERTLIDAVNRHSIVPVDSGFAIEDVTRETLMQDAAVVALSQTHSEDHLHEILEELHQYELIREHGGLGWAEYRATYCGFTRVNRQQVLQDREIDELRFQGESDSLDYKRVLDLSSRKAKIDFAKDVLAFANTGGSPVKHILVGVNDDGSFHQPADATAHRESVHSLKDITLQQIVSERAIHAPSVTISAKGDHRDGPYTLIAIKSDPRNSPYRFFAEPNDAKQPGVSESGEVWVRKGTTKHPATPDEIVALERRAELYRQAFPG